MTRPVGRRQSIQPIETIQSLGPKQLSKREPPLIIHNSDPTPKLDAGGTTEP